MEASNPWDPFSVGKNDDGTWDVLIRARVSIEGLLEAQTDVLGVPGASEEGHLSMLANASNMVGFSVASQLVGRQSFGASVTVEGVQVTAAPGSTSAADRLTGE